LALASAVEFVIQYTNNDNIQQHSSYAWQPLGTMPTTAAAMTTMMIYEVQQKDPSHGMGVHHVTLIFSVAVQYNNHQHCTPRTPSW
jgi:hypothetical protein